MDNLEIMTSGMSANLKEFGKRVLELGESIFTTEPADHKGPFYEMRHIELVEEKTGPFNFSSEGEKLVIEAITDFLGQNFDEGVVKLFWIRNLRMSREYLSLLAVASWNLWNIDLRKSGLYLSYLPFLDRDEEIDSIYLPEFGIVRFISDKISHPGRGHEVKGFIPLFNSENLRVEEEEIKSYSYDDLYLYHIPGFPGFRS